MIQAPKQLSVVIPIYNERLLIDVLFERISFVHHELCQHYQWDATDIEWIVVDDGSTHETKTKLQTLKQTTNIPLTLIHLSRNFGHQVAISAGVDISRGDAIVVMDGDLQDPPEVIGTLIDTYQQGYDVVYAIRSRRLGESWFKRLSATLFYRCLRCLTPIDIPLHTGDFRIMSRRVVTILTQMKEKHRFVRGMVSWIGFKQTGIFYIRDARYAGKTHFSFFKMMRLAIDAITGFSALPLKFISTLGMWFACLGFAYLVYVLYQAMSHHVVQGWSSIVCIGLILGGVQLLCLGVIGEYIGQIHTEIKKRPLYVIESIDT